MSTTLHQRPPFRAEHLGSLLRPEPLLDIRHKIDKGQTGLEKDLKGVEDTSVKEIIQEQLDLGFHAVSDGEYRRHMFWYVSIDHGSQFGKLTFFSGVHSSLASTASKKSRTQISISSECKSYI